MKSDSSTPGIFGYIVACMKNGDSERAIAAINDLPESEIHNINLNNGMSLLEWAYVYKQI
ncbi:hypothetical protein [Rickettsiales endosymbiont of Stachyamoeba lipophora]|uniref:hypothetical protein n=1 Tax=Rickettsiales endosymbiont of Stachyamoeba lipophora TaxID=2486578 RepID=UPI000F654978|nr:hypothetical protein [Rickettsiales endosymbiont of Stachyamoeba lipophora]AZL15149.1 hypothetical protein EF513_01050 [Rickettsiales endosymbiont of Stachyamoeba lipophora]